LYCDIGLIGYINDENYDKIGDIIKENKLFGFISSLSAPLNSKLDQITIKGLVKAI